MLYYTVPERIPNVVAKDEYFTKGGASLNSMSAKATNGLLPQKPFFIWLFTEVVTLECRNGVFTLRIDMNKLAKRR